jgi:Zn-dependent protease with chaperone function
LWPIQKQPYRQRVTRYLERWMSTSHSDLPAGVQGLYYDGRSSRSHEISFRIEGGLCRITGIGIDKAIPVLDITVSEQLDKAHRLLHFRDGTSCELPDNAQLSTLLKKTRLGDGIVNRLQRSWRWVIISFVLIGICVFAGYKWGLPFIAEKLAYRIPYAVLQTVSEQAMSTLDGRFIKPSRLAPERQEQLRERFSRVSFPQKQRFPVKVQFRDGDFGANAFALPDGTIVFFDKLVELTDNDDELVAVFAHEAGHVAKRHSMRQLIQSSIVALALAAYLGDVSSLAGALSGWLLQAKYSRDFERDADRFAAATLRSNNLSPRLLASFLLKLEESHKKPSAHRGDKIWDYLSSHPATEERIKEMESLSAGQTAP